MTELGLGLAAACVLLMLADWRRGLLLTVAVGLLQDPLRKVAPGEPVYFVLFAAATFAVAWSLAMATGLRLAPSAILGWREYVGRAFVLFVVLVLGQAIHSLAVFGSLQMTGIGLMVWLAPVPAMMLAYHFALSTRLEGIRRWLGLYASGVLVFACSVYLQFSGMDLPVFGEVGEGLLISGPNGPLQANSGLFRSSEMAAWHMASAACFVLVLLTSRRAGLEHLLLAGLLIAFLLTMGVLTGRRKMLVEVVLFSLLYFGLHTWYRGGGLRTLLTLAGLSLCAYLVLLTVFDTGDAPAAAEQAHVTSDFGRYAQRGGTAFGEIPRRFEELGVDPIFWAVGQLGPFGSGLGTGSQNTGGDGDLRRNIGAAEGGLGKIMVELGLPGLLLLTWLACRLLLLTNYCLRLVTTYSIAHARVAYGLLAFIGAKAASFSVATQAFSDPFVLLVLGICLGYFFALPQLSWHAWQVWQSGPAVQERSWAP